MDSVKVFYSWQSDTKSKFNRNFIEDCLMRAIKITKKEIDVEFAIDRDTKNEVGTPDIADTIFRKIDESNLFIADITFINSINDEEVRITPNPNVLIELGYAAAKLGWENIICIFNSAFGDLEHLPFDIRTRRILVYELNENEDILPKRQSLSNTLEGILKTLDIDKIHLKRMIVEKYRNEPKRIYDVAIRLENDWEFKLMTYLMDDRFVKVNFRYDRLTNGLASINVRRISGEEFLDRSIELNSTIGKIIEVIGRIINKEFIKCIGEPGESGDVILALTTINNLEEELMKLVDIEYELHSYDVRNSYAGRIRDCMFGVYFEIMKQLKIIPREFEKVFNGYYKDGDTVSIQLTFILPPSYEEINNILSEIRHNLNLLLDDDIY